MRTTLLQMPISASLCHKRKPAIAADWPWVVGQSLQAFPWKIRVAWQRDCNRLGSGLIRLIVLFLNMAADATYKSAPEKSGFRGTSPPTEPIPPPQRYT